MFFNLFFHSIFVILSHRDSGGLRGYDLDGFEPPHPNPLPDGEREPTEIAARSVANEKRGRTGDP